MLTRVSDIRRQELPLPTQQFRNLNYGKPFTMDAQLDRISIIKTTTLTG